MPIPCKMHPSLYKLTTPKYGENNHIRHISLFLTKIKINKGLLNRSEHITGDTVPNYL